MIVGTFYFFYLLRSGRLSMSLEFFKTDIACIH